MEILHLMYNVPCRYFNHTLIIVYFYHVIRPFSVQCMNLRETSDFVLRKCLFFRLVTFDKLKKQQL